MTDFFSLYGDEQRTHWKCLLLCLLGVDLGTRAPVAFPFPKAHSVVSKDNKKSKLFGIKMISSLPDAAKTSSLSTVSHEYWILIMLFRCQGRSPTARLPFQAKFSTMYGVRCMAPYDILRSPKRQNWQQKLSQTPSHANQSNIKFRNATADKLLELNPNLQTPHTVFRHKTLLSAFPPADCWAQITNSVAPVPEQISDSKCSCHSVVPQNKKVCDKGRSKPKSPVFSITLP